MTTTIGSIRFRPARDEDAGAVLEIWHEGWWDAHGAVAPEALRRHRDRDGTTARIPAAIPVMGIAEVDGAIAGFVSIDGNQIVNFYVARPYRGTGLARELLAEGVRMAAAGGADSVYLWCAAGNDRARRFYLKQGWRDEGVHDHDVPTPDGPMPVPCHRMVRSLAAGGNA